MARTQTGILQVTLAIEGLAQGIGSGLAKRERGRERVSIDLNLNLPLPLPSTPYFFACACMLGQAKAGQVLTTCASEGPMPFNVEMSCGRLGRVSVPLSSEQRLIVT